MAALVAYPLYITSSHGQLFAFADSTIIELPAAPGKGRCVGAVWCYGRKDNKKMRKFLGTLVLSLAAMTAAYANPPGPPPGGWTQPKTGWTQSELQALDNWLDQFGEQFEDWFYDTWGSVLGVSDPDSGHGTVAAPEFDPAAALAALSLLSGGLAVLRGRRSKRSLTRERQPN
jgi:hypothetical protein